MQHLHLIQSDKDKAKLVGPGLLVCTRDTEQKPDAFQLAVGEGGAVRLHDGSEALPEGDAICGQVPFQTVRLQTNAP